MASTADCVLADELIKAGKWRQSPRCATHRGDNFVIKYLDEIDTEFEITLVCLRPRWVRIMKKTVGRNSRETLPLMFKSSLYMAALQSVLSALLV